MAIKSGELIHVGNQVLVDRAQTAGPGSLNIPREVIYELGNYQSVGQVFDTPDLKFSLDSFDCSAQLEALLTGTDFTAMAAGDGIDLSTVRPLDVASLFKAGKTSTNPFEVEGSVAIPYLLADSISYDFGIHSNAKQTASLSGDALYYSGGSTYIEEFTGTATADQTCLLSHTVIPYTGDTTNGTKYALSVSLVHSGKRLTLGTDYAEAASGAGSTKTVTLTVHASVPLTETIRVSYQSDVKATYPQASNAPASAVKPAALRGRDIEIRVAGSSVTNRWSSVQSFQGTWSVTLDKNEELGNPLVVSQDFDVPDVKGSITLKPRDITELVTRVSQIAGVTDGSVVGPQSSVALPLEVILHSPVDGSVLKTIYVPDARFTLPGFQGQVQQKLTVKLDYVSDGGICYVYKGLRSSSKTQFQL